ncbi:hypothetical protein [Nonomuraea sp. KM90]|uniref:hypothetical protein n=1 Tax=Nonomuraea sp. KM90 TaxID=3457428 RepID=UPI003FCE914A
MTRMIAGEGPPPRTVMAAALLTSAMLPFGTVVTAMNSAVGAETEQVVREAPAARPHLVRPGLRQHVDTVARVRTAEPGALFVLSALVLGMLTWVSQRGFRGVGPRSGPVWSRRQRSRSARVTRSGCVGRYPSNPVADAFRHPLWDI